MLGSCFSPQLVYSPFQNPLPERVYLGGLGGPGTVGTPHLQQDNSTEPALRGGRKREKVLPKDKRTEGQDRVPLVFVLFLLFCCWSEEPSRIITQLI